MALNKNEVLKTLKKAGNTVTQTVDGLRKSTKLTFDISTKDSELADLYRELGRSVYECSKGESERLSPEALMSMIEASEQELEQLKRKKNARAAAPVCPACGREVSKKASFCQTCGAKIVPDKKEPQPAATGEDGDFDEPDPSVVTPEEASALGETDGPIPEETSEDAR